MDNYKDECMKRFEYSKSYEKYNQEDLIDELYEKDIQNEDLQQRIDKAVEYINKNILIGFNNAGFKTDKVAGIIVDELLNILKGDDTNDNK